MGNVILDGQIEFRYKAKCSSCFVMRIGYNPSVGSVFSAETGTSKHILTITHYLYLCPSNLLLSSIYPCSQRLSAVVITDLPENSWEFSVFLTRKLVGQLRCLS